jgi:hypothetical protein
MPPVLRSILAVMVGFIVMSVTVGLLTAVSVALLHEKSGSPTSGYIVFNIVYSLLAAFAGGAVAALVAGRKPVLHGAVMAAIMVAAGTYSFVHVIGRQPIWYQLFILIVPPLVVVGGAAIVARSNAAAKLSRL